MRAPGMFRPAATLLRGNTTVSTKTKPALAGTAGNLPLHKAIYEVLRDGILQGNYQHGDRLPSEAALCEHFDTSRITIAKAIHSLQRDGLVTRRAGSGTYIQLPQPVAGHQFGILIPELGSTEIFEPICKGIMRSPLAKTHALLWGHTSSEEDKRGESALELCGQFIAQKVSGVFFAPIEYVEDKDRINARIAADLCKAGIPVVLLDRCFQQYPLRSNLDLVGIDNHRAGFVLTQHLWQQGARRIVFAARAHSAGTVIERISGYRLALHELGAEQPGEVLLGNAGEKEFASALIERHRADAVVCGNDLTAAVLMRTLIAMQVRVPEQMRIVGFDDVAYARFLPVPLTTIHQNCAEMGEIAMSVMLNRMEHADRRGVDVRVPFELVVRDSCGAARAG
jgi:GntR family transcriptional regulator of arabinose operon